MTMKCRDKKKRKDVGGHQIKKNSKRGCNEERQINNALTLLSESPASTNTERAVGFAPLAALDGASQFFLQILDIRIVCNCDLRYS
jgi:hypothetical protein